MQATSPEHRQAEREHGHTCNRADGNQGFAELRRRTGLRDKSEVGAGGRASGSPRSCCADSDHNQSATRLRGATGRTG
eukprot:12004662-Alexandrium_andersonii.AAC.1